MEHFSLLQPSAALPAPAGMRLILVQVEEGGDRWRASHEVLSVVGIQPLVVHHFSRDEAAPVSADPAFLERHGWRFKHLELRYAPIYLTRDGQLVAAQPDDPCWRLIEPGTPDETVQTLAETLKAREVSRCETERLIEEEESGSVEGD